MRDTFNKSNNDSRNALTEGIDFYFEDGLMVLTEKFLRERGYCCENGCRHCPYPKEGQNESK